MRKSWWCNGKSSRLGVKWLSLKSQKPSGRIPISNLDGLWEAFYAVITLFLFSHDRPHQFNFYFSDYSSSALSVTCFLWESHMYIVSEDALPALLLFSHQMLIAFNAACMLIRPRSMPPALRSPLSAWLRYQLGFSFWMSGGYLTVHPNSLLQWVIPTTYYPSNQPLKLEYDSCH